MTNKNKPSLTCLQEWLEVDPTSPSGLRWKKRRNGRSLAGSPAGYLENHGYWVVSFDFKKHLAHRLVLELSGQPCPAPKLEADHVNRNRSDNRLENLRWVTRGQNTLNRACRSQTGFKWVQPTPQGFRFESKVRGSVVKARGLTPEQAFYRGIAKRLEVSWI